MADRSPSKRKRLLWAALLVAACAVIYANGVTGAYTYDDKAVVRDNPRIRSPRSIRKLVTTSYFGGPRGTGSAYRPILLLSFAVEWWVHGNDVVIFHVVNIALHAGTTLLLFALLLRIGLSPPAAGAAALLFAVAPVHVEAVTSLVGRGETLAALFVLLFLLAALESFKPWRPPRASRLAALLLAMLCFCAAVLTKESGAIAPALAFLLFAFVTPGSLRVRLWSAFSGGLPLFLLSAAVLAGVFRLRAWVLGGALRSTSSGIFEVENALAPLRPWARMSNACLIFPRYLGRCVFPLHLSGDESAWSIRPLPAASPLALAAVALLFVLTVLSVVRLSDGSVLALGFLFFAVALLPTGNLLFPIGTIFAERIAYLPSAGICLILGKLLAGDTAALPMMSPVRRSALLVVVLFFSARAIVRNAVWWSDEGLFSNLVATAPGSAKAHYDLAYVAADEHRDRLARDQYAQAIAIYPGYWDAWAGKGRVEKESGLLAEAERSYEKSVEVHPGYENGYYGLGQVREARHDDAGAETAYRRGLKQISRSLPLAYHLALLSGRRGEKSAAGDWRRALDLGGGLCSVRSDYARWLLGRGRLGPAAAQAREALRRDSACVGAWRVLADRAEQKGMRLARTLALERISRLTKSPSDRKSFQDARRLLTGE